MNPFPPEGNMQHGWEVIDRDAAPSIKCKYELDEDEEDREEALQQCAADAWLWLNELPAGEYGVQFGVQYELPDVQFVGIDVPQSVQRQRNFQWNDWKNRRVPSPPAAVETIADDLLNELANKYGSDEWNPVTVYMRVRRGTGGIVLRDLGTATKERRLQEKNVRDGAKRTQKESAQRQRRAGQRPDGTTAQRNAAVRRVQKTGRPQQRKLDPTGLVRAVALVLCGDTPNSAAHTRKIDALLNVVSSLLDDEAKLAALEAARGIAITVWSPEGDQLRTPPVDLDEGATAVHLQRDADGMYALVTDAQRYLARHAEHACRNPHCTKGEHGNPFRAARASKVHEHEQRQCCLKCPQCGEDFADADDFEAGLEALERHVEQSKSVPCVGKAEREKRAIAQNLPGLVPFSIAVDIEAVPEAGEAPRGVVFRMDEAGDPLPIAKLGFAGARRSLIVRYETCTVTPCDTSEKEPTAVLHCTPDARPDDSTMDAIATLTLGDVFEVVWSDGTRVRYVNAIENARTGGITTAFRTSACTGGVTTDFRAKPHPIAMLTATIDGLEVSYAETRRARECDDAAAPVKATFACTPNAPPDALALRAIASLQHGDVFEVVLPTDEDHPEGMRKRFVNAVGADRHTAGDQLTTMVCWKLSPPLVDHLHRAAEKERLKREMNHRPNATDFPRDERWTCTDAARGAFCTVYRQDADGVPLLDHHILAAFIGFLDALDGRLRTIAERGARWHARCKLLAEWCYRHSSAEPRTHADFRAWSAGKRLDFWKQYEMQFVNAALLEAGVVPLSNNTRKGEPHVDEHLSVCGTGSGVLALRAWLTDEPQRAEYERLVVNKLKDVQQERVTVLAHNGSGYDYFKFLKSLLRLQRAADVDALESNNRLINLEYKKRYTFHDSMLQILGRLDKLARDFGAR